MRNELQNTLTGLNAMHPEWVDHIVDVQERYPYDRMVGLVVGDNGEPYDVCFNWETCEQYSTDGMRVLALQADGPCSRVELQGMCDRNRAAYRDCFGV